MLLQVAQRVVLARRGKGICVGTLYVKNRFAFFSTSASSEATNSPKEETSIDSEAHKSTPLAQGITSSFPWRSSSVPLDRVLARDDLSGLEASTLTREMRPLFVAVELNISLFQMLFTTGWKQELEQDFSYAFQKGVAGLLSWKYQVPIELIETSEDGIVFDSTANNSESVEKDAIGTFDEKQAEFYVKGMLEPKLIDTYQQVPGYLRFEMKPLSGGARIENLIVVNSLTREDVDRNPSLKGSYSKIEAATNDANTSTEEHNRMMDDLLSNTDTEDRLPRTLIADVTVKCLESFCTKKHVVKEAKEVTHLVRFEMETRGVDEWAERTPTRWRIVDWDDTLGGNLWA